MINVDLAFVFQVVNFLVLLLILNVFLYRPIRKVMADRNAEIGGARDKAASVDREVQEKVALYESRLKEVRAKAAEERGVLKKSAAAEEAVIIEKARTEATDSVNALKNRIAKEATEAREMLREQARTLSLDICQKILGRSL